MSADNYLLVRPYQDQWAVTMEFASSPPRPISPRNTPAELFPTRQEALDYAYQDEEEHYYEYGVVIAGEDEARLLAAKASDQAAVASAVRATQARYHSAL